jgi:putative endonuclease
MALTLEKTQNKNWFVYLLECSDGTYYTGITTDLHRRITEHNNDDKRGASYTKGRRPVKLVWYEAQNNRSLATKQEKIIRRQTREKKQELIEIFCK